MSNLLSVFPGATPGLLRRGSPVIWSDLPPDHQMYRAWALVVRGLWTRAGEVLADLGGAQTGVPLTQCDIDLTDATGRAHLAWWADERAPGTSAHEQRGTSPFMSIPERIATARAQQCHPMTPELIDVLARLGLRLAGRTA